MYDTHYDMFQHTAARRRLENITVFWFSIFLFQHTAARRRLVLTFLVLSRLKVGFNTQPPEGGWKFVKLAPAWFSGFNTQPPEGGWDGFSYAAFCLPVSTHSRPKAAGLV